MLAERKEYIQDGNNKIRISNYEKTKFDVSLISINFTDSIKGESEYELNDPQMSELAESIKTVGLIQPIVLRKIGILKAITSKGQEIKQEGYEVVAGRRRFTAISKILKWKTVDAIVRDYDDSIDTLAVQFQENEERKAWTDHNYATAIKMLREKKPGISTIEIAKTFNKTPDWVKKKNDHIRVIDSFEKVNGEGATSHLAELSTSEINATGQVKDETARVDLITDILEAKGRGEDLTIAEIREKAALQGQEKRKEHNENLPPVVRKFNKPIQQELIPKTDYQIYEELRENIFSVINSISAVDAQMEGLCERKKSYSEQLVNAEKAFKKFETEKKTIKLRSHSTKKIEAIHLKRFPFETCYPYRENKIFLDPYYKKGWIGNDTLNKTTKNCGSSEMKFKDIKKGTLVFASREVNGEVSGWFKCEVV
ncbi:MAG TPA: ParB/RepB/Spo0J family partition protein [Leptospiraceae bacterium]|nr:ParB/RepB/Spo0J family partition protein [Leptospiraceae bacterium]